MTRYDRETLFHYYYRFARDHRGASAAWAVMSIFFTILNIVAFYQPQWIGDTMESPGYGHMGVYSYCLPDHNAGQYKCEGNFAEFNTILNLPFKISTVFTGISALLMLIVVVILLLFFCVRKERLNLLLVPCGVMQVFSGRSCSHVLATLS